MKKKRARTGCITIGGYYGYGNVGDEAVLFSVLSMIAKRLPGRRVFVLTRDPPSLPQVDGIEVVAKSRRSPFAVVSAFFASQLYISGGGSLFQDKTSGKSLFYYCTLIRLAKLLGCKVCILSNGMGPLKNERLCKKALFCADMVSLRDCDSFDLARRLMGGASAPLLSADPAFAYPFPEKLQPSFDLPESPFVAVSIRGFLKGEDRDMKEAEKAFLTLSNNGRSLVFVSMQDSFDLKTAMTMAERTGGIAVGPKTMGELFYILERAEVAIGMRLHFLICAAMAGTPSVPLVYDPKVEGCMKGLGIACPLKSADVSSEEILLAVDSARREFSEAAVKKACREARKKAVFDMECAAELMGEGFAEEAGEEKFFADT